MGADSGSSALPGALHHVVIVGGGFGGLYAAQALGRAPVRVTVVDRRNFHLFQPLLYQVATGGLSPADIAKPIRAVLRRQRNTTVIAAEVIDFLPEERRVVLEKGSLQYDTLILSPGLTHHYFGHDEWMKVAPGLKSLEDALEVRARVFRAFETAEAETDAGKRRPWMHFVIVGGGPTGVELAGALGELAEVTLREDFRNIDTRSAEILLVEGGDRLLPTFPASLSRHAETSLRRLGVEVRTRTRITRIETGSVTMLTHEDREETLETRTVLWAAGMKPSPLGRLLAGKIGAACDATGRVIVNPDLTIPGHPEILIIGDLARVAGPSGEPLPGVAPVAIQQGRYAAKLVKARLDGRTLAPFRFWNKGLLAVIGRNAAVADFGRLHAWGWPAWLLWLFVHIWYLIGFDSKILVLVQWGFYYFTRKNAARLVTGVPDPDR